MTGRPFPRVTPRRGSIYMIDPTGRYFM